MKLIDGKYRSRKNKKRAHSRRRAFIRSYARPEKIPAPQLSNVGLAIRQLARQMGDRGK